ncbi:MAG: L-seryl-tRNA(Sec) selenium transferase [Planctomycetota bacterium]|nr:L-seryl-tRNA(Sec) selenium transferase [Planctomycetota bacterium]
MEAKELLRSLPAIDRLLRTDEVRALHERWLPRIVDAELRTFVEELRARIRDGQLTEAKGTGAASIAAAVGERLEERLAPGSQRCINATGVVLHTGLGRAVLPAAARDALQREVAGYTVVSVDRAKGERIRRETTIAQLLCALTGAEAATVVNNNAAATLIALNTLAGGREAAISRGQLVEIGGSFRMPDVFRAAHVRLNEVGTTNRTHLRDFARAIGPDTGLLLRVHPSNFKVVGFTHDVPLEEMVALGREHDIPVMDDLGAGALIDLPGEPEIAESLRTGADLVTCSGDKLIGGPQAGILLGRSEIIDRVRRNALFRALRVDKLTLVALEATVRLFMRPGGPGDDHPTLRMLHLGEETLKRSAEELRRLLAESGCDVKCVRDMSQVGSGSMPTETLPTWLVAIAPAKGSASRLARNLRLGTPPIYTRIVDDRVCLDPRTLQTGEALEIVRALDELT